MATVVYRGNHQPDLDADRPPEQRREPWSTETHIAAAWEQEGHTVVRVQEDAVGWAETVDACRDADLFLWTCTWGMAHRWDQADAWAAVAALTDRMPTAFWHLDKWWDLPRVDQIVGPDPEPWTRLGWVFTADGGNQDRWEEAGVNHRWLPPAVHGPDCGHGTRRDEWVADVAFVGNWRGGYHPEWEHRAQLVSWLRQTYGYRVRFWPNGEQIRGKALRDLYASVGVVVGDSCLIGGRGFYSSDRIPETVGRGGFLLHPFVKGVIGTDDGDLFRPGVHLEAWDLGDWARLAALIDHYHAHPVERAAVAAVGAAYVAEHHTYAVRVREMLAALAADGATVR